VGALSPNSRNRRRNKPSKPRQSRRKKEPATPPSPRFTWGRAASVIAALVTLFGTWTAYKPRASVARFGEVNRDADTIEVVLQNDSQVWPMWKTVVTYSGSSKWSGNSKIENATVRNPFSQVGTLDPGSRSTVRFDETGFYLPGNSAIEVAVCIDVAYSLLPSVNLPRHQRFGFYRSFRASAPTTWIERPCGTAPR